jgi:hypothetical protein
MTRKSILKRRISMYGDDPVVPAIGLIRGAHADTDQGRDQSTVREPKRRPAFEYVPDLRGLDRSAGGLYGGKLARWDHLLRASFSEPTLLKLAYSYEQAAHHRIPPKLTPGL